MTNPVPLRVCRLVPAAALAAAAIAALGCDPPRGERADAAARTSIVLITLDTTRADHTSAYGYARPTTPTLAALLPDAVRFDAAYSPLPTTLPAHAALFTARSPRALGVLKNDHVLRDDAVTLAERLLAAGWRTGGFVSSFVLDRRLGIMQGFETYDDRFFNAPCKAPLQSREGPVQKPTLCRRGEETVALAIAWLEDHGYLDVRADDAGATAPPAPPFFLFVHLFDPHNPYMPPPAHAARFPPPGADPTALEHDVARYDGEIHYADAQVGTLLARLTESGRLDHTLVVVTADHGEGLMQHGWMYHDMQLYEEAVRVPLVVRWPARVRGGRTVAAPVGLVDLAPTILELVGVDGDLPATEGRSFAGVLLGGAAAAADRPMFFQRRFYESPTERGVRVKGAKYGVRQGDWKYIEAREEGTRELYDLARDPGERTNVVDQEPDRAAHLTATIAAWTAGGAPPSRSVGAEDVERLRALGYLQ